MKNIYGIKGNIIFSPSFGKLEILSNGTIIVEDGIVNGVYKELPIKYKDISVTDYKNKLIIPGFIDLHLHAPQFPNMGIGLDKELMPWLNKYTFPEEEKYSDIKYSEKIYKLLIKEL